MMEKVKKYGLIGYPLSHSFSPSYFKKKFDNLGITDTQYKLYPLEKIEEVCTLMDGGILGFNVTIPYKKSIIEYLDIVTEEAQIIGAVNTVKIVDGTSFGYNTDIYGFRESLLHLVAGMTDLKALILGTGGAAVAVKYVLDTLGIKCQYVSRKEPHLNYHKLDKKIIQDHLLIVNTTPLGMAPKLSEAPDIPYQYISSDHILFDLIYNPEKTLFLTQGEQRGSKIMNGYRMLELQADKAWEIWNKQ